MKKLTKIFIVLIIFNFQFSIFNSHAQSPAASILEKTSALLASSQGITVDFVFNLKDKSLNQVESFEGKILIKGEKFLIETPDRDIYFNGKTQWIHDRSIDEVNILEPTADEIKALNPILLFDSYKTDWTYTFKGDKTDVKSRKVKEINLVPKATKSDIKQITMQISASDYMPLFFRIYYKNNAENLIYVGKYDTKTTIPDSRFVFDTKKHPEAEVIDLR